MATLPSHALRFHKASKDKSGKCNAFATGDGRCVIGVLFSIDAAERAKLDAAEGVGKGYECAIVTVLDAQGRQQTALTYLATAETIDDALKPYGWYKAYVRAGAQEHGLPADYIARCIDKVEAIEDADRNRDRRERSTLGLRED